MSSAIPTTQTAIVSPHQPSLPAAILSYLIPGLGQIYQGRYGKGILFMISLLGMFFLGQAMGNWQNVYVQKEEFGRNRGVASLFLRWHYAGQFWIGVAAWPALWQYFGMPVPALPEQNHQIEDNAEPEAPLNDRLRTFMHNFQKMPKESEVNEFLKRHDKTPDLGWVYTVIAGMLNILVIYDAYAGAAFPPGSSRPSGREQAVPISETKREGAV